jgi:hypothetical protein
MTMWRVIQSYLEQLPGEMKEIQLNNRNYIYSGFQIDATCSLKLTLRYLAAWREMGSRQAAK